jgi:ABC-type multidrug transport system fused ATPase/permease subunit
VLLLPSQPLLFIGSIASNICYGRAGTPSAAMQGAGMAAGKSRATSRATSGAMTCAAGLHEFVAGLSDGYETSVEDHLIAGNPALQQVHGVM